MAINLYLVRHGQTLFNAQQRMQGSCDSALTKLGIKQAEALRDYFKKKQIVFDKAYCSTQERASDTLEIIVGPEMDYERLKDLKEKNYGPFEAKKNFWWPLMKFRSGSMEDNREVVERMERGINLILRDAKDGENILVVGHGDSMSRYICEKAGHHKFHGFHNAEYVQLKSNGHEVEYVKSCWPAKKLKIEQLTEK
ncbi:histidine phosphatase family protein [Lactobacillus gallinarum]|uniref:histidine phosphatase family protein n=1 Tax=Lactobacillus gallinarum TaxID=52242 RepID=UPI0024BBA2C6|nr:histidine phosphatase family protein [Lactobacillus gallinarum]